MKRLLYILLFMLLISLLQAQGFNVQFSPKQQIVNSFGTFEMDPFNPESQSFLTNLTINKLGLPQRFELQVQIMWNNAVIVGEGDALYRSITELPAGVTLTLSNRDILSNQDGLYLQPVTAIDILEAVKTHPILEDALLAGYFPDGNLQLVVSIRAMNSSIWESTDTFTLVIRNAGAIHLSSPGKRINQVPPKVSHLPVTFIWNSVATTYNEQYLIIREFGPTEMPQSQTVESRGALVYHSPMSVSSGFSEYLPFNDGCYYAWQVYSPLHDSSHPYDPDSSNPASDNRLTSPWFVFQYEDDGADALTAGEIYGILSQLQNEIIMNLLMQGYMPTGEVFLDGRSYHNQEALDIIESLAGKEFQVEIKE